MLSCMARDSEATKRKLLAAAVAEFADYGISGARIDRIAERAGANKRMLYAYYGNKEQLFETVIGLSLTQFTSTIPLDPGRLPEYAGELFDYLVRHPDRRRLALWRLLERPQASALELASAAGKLSALSRARPHDTALSPNSLLIFVIAIAFAWPNATDPQRDPQPTEVDDQRANVVEAVRRLVISVPTA
jgi:AcrR family transcriptional regulator